MTARFFRWPSPGEPRLPQHPYRDSALLHGALACAIVLLAWATGGTVDRAALVALAYFAVATAWSWWRFRSRSRRKAEEARK